MNYLWISYQPLSGSVKGSCPPTPPLTQYFAVSLFFIVNCFVLKLLKAVSVATGSQVRNMSIGEQLALLRNIRNGKICLGEKPYRFWNLRK